jgi:hypothetical protein
MDQSVLASGKPLDDVGLIVAAGRASDAGPATGMSRPRSGA